MMDMATEQDGVQTAQPGDGGGGTDSKKESGSGRRWRRIFGVDRVVGMGLLLCLVVLRLADPYPVEFFRVKIFDMYQKFHPRDIPPPEQKVVTIVDIDEDSLAELGQWPWDRVTIAQMIANLANMGAILTAFDVVFAEPDRMNPQSIADTLITLDEETREKLRTGPSNDETMADIMKQTRVIAGYAGFWEEREQDAGRPPLGNTAAIRAMSPGAEQNVWMLPNYPSLVRNIPVIEEAATGHGVFSLIPELDGVIRRVPTVFRYGDGDRRLNALSVEMMRVATGRQTVFLKMRADGVESVGIAKGMTLPTDGQGRVWPYFSNTDKSKYISARDVLAGTVDPAMVQNKMMIVGTSAVGLRDIRQIPTERDIPGVEVHAQVIEATMTNKFLSRPQFLSVVEMTVMFLGGLLMVILVPMIGARWTLGLFLIIAGGTAYGSWYLFTEQLILYDGAYGVAAILVLYTALTYAGYAREEGQRRQVREAFAHYLSPAMVQKLAENPDQLKLGGETRDLTVMFSDIRGFTSLSEKYDAQGLTQLINKLLTPLTDIVLEYKGTVDKYMGDCIMAFWNAPLDDPDHAKNCIKAAMIMNGSMDAINDKLRAEAAEEGKGHDDLKMGIGINTGDIVVGNMGSDQRFDYSCLGDNVNLGSRLEGQSKTYRVDIVIGENTARKAPDLPLLELDLIKVKGKQEAVTVYTCVGDEEVAESDAFKALQEAHDGMVAAYRTQDWAKARDLLAKCKDLSDGFPVGEFYSLYDERLDEFETAPPPADWDGVYVATSK